MRSVYLIANWKMNPLKKEEAVKLAKIIGQHVPAKSNVRVALCPPFLFIPALSGNKKIALGAQNCFYEKGGPFTGEVSAAMLAKAGCTYVIVGHSERRAMGEDNALINKKIIAALAAGLTPVLAVGEKTHPLTSAEEGHAHREMQTQIEEALQDIPGSKMKRIIMAYEPVWAISKGDPSHISATPEDVFSSTLLIRKTIANRYSRTVAESMPVLYGGTSNSHNLQSFLEEGHADGALVGGASLDAKEFSKMIRIASRHNEKNRE